MQAIQKKPARLLAVLTAVCMALGLLPAVSAPARAAGEQYQPLTVSSGYNEDVVAEAKPASTTTTAPFDSKIANDNNALYSVAYNAAGGLPVDGKITSITDPPVAYQLASYTGNNALRLDMLNTAEGSHTGTLTFSTLGAYSRVSVLGASASGAAWVNLTINYSDGSSSTQRFGSKEWFFVETDIAFDDLGRVNREESQPIETSGPQLYQYQVATDPTKLITGITFTESAMTAEEDGGVYTNTTPAGRGSRFDGSTTVVLLAVSGVISGDAPAAPGNVTASGIGEDGFVLSWDSVSGAAKYAIDISENESFIPMIPGFNNFQVTENPFTVSGLDGDTGYYVRVRAVNDSGQSLSSEVISVTTEPPSTVDVGDFRITGKPGGYTLDNGHLTITGGGRYTIAMKSDVTDTAMSITVAQDVKAAITLDGVLIDASGTEGGCAFALADGAEVNLLLAGESTLKSGRARAGLEAPEGTALVIDTADRTPGKEGILNASSSIPPEGKGTSQGAGIGGGNGKGGGAITINGGVINACSSDAGDGMSTGFGAGIGGGNGGDGGTIVINGGTVTAYSSKSADGALGAGAGIGGGNGGNGGVITIDGGSVTACSSASGSAYGAGIGGGNGSGGKGGEGGAITINDGEVHAYGSQSGGSYGAGLGGGFFGTGGTIEVNGGEVWACASQSGRGSASGIGSGVAAGHSGSILITDGLVNAFGSESGEGNGPGIGGTGSGGSVEISGGEVNACSSRSGMGYNAGILSEEVTVSGGRVYACSSEEKAGYGPGIGGDEITVSDGVVYAFSSDAGTGYGAGIGGSGGGLGIAMYLEEPEYITMLIKSLKEDADFLKAISDSSTGGDGGLVTISGGSVTACSSGEGTGYGAGIGGGAGASDILEALASEALEEVWDILSALGSGGAGGTVLITGGDVTACSSQDDEGYGAGIGGGSTPHKKEINGESCTIEIDYTGREGAEMTAEGGMALSAEPELTGVNGWKISRDAAYTDSSVTEYAYSVEHAFLGLSADAPEEEPGTAPTITISALPGGYVGASYSQALAADGDSPITWTIVDGSGSLPQGLSLNASTGVISGTPTAAGTASFTVKASNSAGSDTAALSIAVSVIYTPGPEPEPDSVTTPAPEDKTTGTVEDTDITVSGDQKIITGEDGSVSLPGGGKLNINDRVAFDAPAGTVIDPAGTVTIPADASARLALEESRATVTVPGGTTIDTAGEITVGGQAVLVLSNNNEITLPLGSTILGNTVTVGPGGGTAVAGGETITLEEGAVLILDGDIPLGYYLLFQNPFADVSEDDWFYNAVKYVWEKGIMQGTGEDTFAPGFNLNRAMMVQILFNLEGASFDGSAGYDDVADDQWYSQAVAWGTENGIVDGIGSNLFAPLQDVTREQMAVMLYRYCAYKQLQLPADRTGGFRDADAVGQWAAEAVDAMYRALILNGRGGDIFDPRGSAIRAEVAQMMMNFMQIIG